MKKLAELKPGDRFMYGGGEGGQFGDIGAGTGSVSIEMALAAPLGYVYAVECDAVACSLIKQNRDKFHVHNLTLVEGKAPEKLTGLPAPDAVFIGGSKGNLPPDKKNVFTAKANENGTEQIAAASFEVMAKQMDYTVSIYTGLTDVDNPESGELKAQKSGSF